MKRLQAALLAEEGRSVELEGERNKLADELAALKEQHAEALARADELADSVDEQNNELQSLDEVGALSLPPAADWSHAGSSLGRCSVHSTVFAPEARFGLVVHI